MSLDSSVCGSLLPILQATCSGGLCSRPQSFQEFYCARELQRFDLIGRSSAGLDFYDSTVSQRKNYYSSIVDFILHTKLGQRCRLNQSGKISCELSPAPKTEICPNEFPYYADPGISHNLLWSSTQLKLTDVEQIFRSKFPPERFDSVIFINPPILQSMPELFHAHMIYREKSNNSK